MAVSDERHLLIRLSIAFVKVSEQYDRELTELKDAALRYKRECDQFVIDKSEKFLALGNKVAVHLTNLHGLLDELRPLVRKIDPTMMQPRIGTPAQRPAKKAPHARKKGV
jgi:hypothetical protein